MSKTTVKNTFPHLLSTFQSHALTLKNRIVLAPMTRCRAEDGQIPSDNMEKFYVKRSDAGLLITEATCIAKDANAYQNTPGIYNLDQAKAWARIVQKVQASNTVIFNQLWHAGMLSHSSYRNGRLPLSPSGIKPLKAKVPRLRVPYEEPMIMNEFDFQTVKQQFCDASQFAVDTAGFNGVELHAANAYLFDTFLHHATNKRTDRYGGPPENMSRFLLEVIDAIAQKIGGYTKIAIRVSPVSVPGMEGYHDHPDDHKVFEYLFDQLNQRKLAYLNISTDDDEKDQGLLGCKVSEFARHHYKGTLIAGGHYEISQAEESLEENHCDLVFFGGKFLANPNLVQLIEEGNVDNLVPFDPKMISDPP